MKRKLGIYVMLNSFKKGLIPNARPFFVFLSRVKDECQNRVFFLQSFLGDFPIGGGNNASQTQRYVNRYINCGNSYFYLVFVNALLLFLSK